MTKSTQSSELKPGQINEVEVLGTTFRFYVQSEEEVQKEYEEKRKFEERLERESQERRLNQLRLNSLMDSHTRHITFDSFTVTEENQKAYELMKGYAEKFDQMQEENLGLLLMGAPGTGKTHLSFAVANHLLENFKSVIAISQGRLIQKTKEISGFGKDEETMFFNSLGDVDLLIIDDLGTEAKSHWHIAKLYEVIDTRYRANKPIIITTNLDTKNLKAYLNTDGVDRIWDRIKEMTATVAFNYGSWRQKKKAVKEDRLNQILLKG